MNPISQYRGPKGEILEGGISDNWLASDITKSVQTDNGDQDSLLHS